MKEQSDPGVSPHKDKASRQAGPVTSGACLTHCRRRAVLCLLPVDPIPSPGKVSPPVRVPPWLQAPAPSPVACKEVGSASQWLSSCHPGWLLPAT